MDRRVALGLIAFAGLFLGLVLGFVPTSISDAGRSLDCGSVIAPADGAEMNLRDSARRIYYPEDGDSYYSDLCSEKHGERKPWMFGALGLGAASGLLAIAIPATRRE